MSDDNALQAHAMLARLRAEPFNMRTEARLDGHPYVLAAEQGTLTTAQQRAFGQEQYHVQLSDAASFAYLAGIQNYRPESLTNATAPEIPSADADSLFAFLLTGELYAASLLLDYAAWSGAGGEAALAAYEPSPLAYGYPSYLAKLALSDSRAGAAAACAVNFPAWGNMCGRVHAALASGQYGDATESDLAFLKFFATPIDGLDDMAAKVMAQEQASYEEIVSNVRLLQGYEVLFWDSVYGSSAEQQQTD